MPIFFYRLLRRIANPSLWMMVMLIGLLHLSLAESRWVPIRDAAYLPALWLGGLCGMALAASRFRGRFALIYSLVLSVGFVAEALGQIVPVWADVFSPSPVDWIWVMHLRLVTLALRMEGWGRTILQGEPIHDTGLFISLLGLATWNVSAWLAWGVGRWRNALAGILPAGLMLALNIHLGGQPLTGLWLFLSVAVVLAARNGFQQMHTDWERRRVDYPEGLGIEWAASALVLALVVGAFARAGPVVGTPQGWRLINEWLRRSQAQMAETTSNLFADVNPPPAERQPITASAANLEQIGAPIDQRPDTVFWVTVSDPPPPPPESGLPNPRQHYWRNAIFDTYTGAGWKRAESVELPNPPAFSTAGRYALQQHFEVAALHGNSLFAANMPISATGDAAVRFLLSDNSPIVEGAASVYDVTSWAADVNALQLNTAPAQYPESIRAVYLQLPETVPQRVRDLAAQITSGAGTPYAKAINVQTYLRETRPYRLDVPPPPAGRDAADYFLFDAPGGFCSYYATAMAVMLRAEGVPARVVAGYATGEFDYERGAYRVPASAAHAWVEVYFPDYGWVEFEPTAALTVFRYADASTSSTNPTADASSHLPSGARFSVWQWAATLAAVVLLAGSVTLLWQWRVARGRSPRQRVLAAYWAARRALGLRAAPSTTPDEFLANHAPALKDRLTLLSALRGLTALYLRAAFSPHTTTSDEAQAARAAGRRVWWERLGQRLARRRAGMVKSPPT
jgi:transglutaminase-like putative cysteine protease